MPTLHEKVGMRIGLTLTDSTIPSKHQVDEFLREGLHRVTDLLDPEDLWPLTKSKSMTYPTGGIKLSDLADSGTDVEGFAEITSVYRAKLDGTTLQEYVRCSEINARDYHKAKNDQNSMLFGSEASPVFTYRDGKLVVLPEPVDSTAGTDGVEINFLSSVTIDSNQGSIPNVPPHAASVVLNYATSQAADVLAAYYAQDEDPMAQNIAAISQAQMGKFQTGVETLKRKRKLRGHVS